MKTVVSGALGECVHVARVTNFIRRVEQAGWRTVFLGPSVSITEFIELTRYLTGVAKHQMPIQTRHPKLAPLSVTHIKQARKDKGSIKYENNPSPDLHPATLRARDPGKIRGGKMKKKKSC